MSNLTGSDDPVKMLTRFFQVFIVGISAIHFFSALVTLLDCAGSKPGPELKRTFSGLAGAVMITLTGCVIVFYQFFSIYSFMSKSTVIETHSFESEGEEVRTVWDKSNFIHYIYFGHGSSPDIKRPQPPEGAGVLTGRFLYEGKPAAGISLYLYLDGKYRSKKLVSDEEGRFRLGLPGKEWTLDLVTTEEWKGKPEGDNFLVVKGDEPPLRDSENYTHHMFREKGLKVNVGEDRSQDDFTLTIRKNIQLLKPGKEEILPMSINDGSIAWMPYDGAGHYLVQLERVERKNDRSTSYYPVAQKRVASVSEMALKEFETVEYKGKKAIEYRVTLYAFKEDKSFLSKSDSYFRGPGFKLEEDLAIADKMKPYMFRDFEDMDNDDLKDLVRTFKEKGVEDKRISAVEVLVEAGMVDEAEKLLGHISDDEAGPGKKDALRGYIQAKKGNCDAAMPLFERATEKGCCVPGRYRAGCEQRK